MKSLIQTRRSVLHILIRMCAINEHIMQKLFQTLLITTHPSINIHQSNLSRLSRANYTSLRTFPRDYEIERPVAVELDLLIGLLTRLQGLRRRLRNNLVLRIPSVIHFRAIVNPLNQNNRSFKYQGTSVPYLLRSY